METNTFSLELRTNDNYADWSVKMKNNLLAQGLWDIVETGLEPPQPDDDVVEYEAWRKMNDAALHAIQSSCGMDILSQINKISSAKIAWETLAEMFMKLRRVLYNTFEQGHSCSSNISESGQDMPTETGDSQRVENGNSLENQDNMETNTLPFELPIGTGVNQRVQSGNFSDNQGRSNSSNISDNGHDKLIQAEAVDPIINEGNSSSSHKPGNIETNTLPLELPTGIGANQRVESENSSDNQCRSNSSNISEIREDDYIFARPLLEAVQSGNWNATRELLMKDHPAALTARITDTFPGGTILHAAVVAEQIDIVEELVDLISEPDLAIQNEGDHTALHMTTISGNQRMAECMITKNRSLVSLRDKDEELPVVMAMGCGHKELARYLYFQTPFQDLKADKGFNGASLLNSCIYNRDLDMALDLMDKCPRLAFALDGRRMSPLEVLAISTEAFESGKGMVLWKQWIYNNCIHISLARAADQFRLNIPNGEEKNIGSVRADLWRQLAASSLLNHLGFKRLYEIKLVRAQFQELLSRMSKAITTLNRRAREQYEKNIQLAIFHAIRRGNFEFVYCIVKENSSFFWMCDIADQRTIFHGAVLHRQHRIFSLIYNLKQKNVVLNDIDAKSRNTILHMAGKLTENTAIDQIRGAALQMQREVQWFKEVESICPLSHKEILNKEDSLTARQLLTRDHQKMREEGERWMKDTATSCTVVGALIITIMFTAAFTIPGGNNQDTGMPILLHDKLFTLFIVADSVSLFSSTTSVLVFLGILTSRYAEEDFLTSLPKKMIIGLFALFFSITTMMIAFSAALLLMLRGKYWTVDPIIGLVGIPVILFVLMLAGIPVILFVLMQSRLLVDMFVSTYRLEIFDRKMKTWF